IAKKYIRGSKLTRYLSIAIIIIALIIVGYNIYNQFYRTDEHIIEKQEELIIEYIEFEYNNPKIQIISSKVKNKSHLRVYNLLINNKEKQIVIDKDNTSDLYDIYFVEKRVIIMNEIKKINAIF